MTPFDPILIAAPARCGTTMFAWLLHLHGVWIGEGEVTQDPDTNPQVPTENTQILGYLARKSRGKCPKDFREKILEMVHTDGPWLVKSAVNLDNKLAWRHHFPNAKWMLLTRPIEDIIKSRVRSHRRSNDGMVKEHRRKQQDTFSSVANAKWVDMDLVCNGGEKGEEEARKALAFCGIEMKPEIYHGWVDPERWNRG